MPEIVSNNESRGIKSRSSIRFAGAAIFALALGLGVNAAIFSGGLQSLGIHLLHPHSELSSFERQRDTRPEEACERAHQMNHADSARPIEKQITPCDQSQSRDRAYRIGIGMTWLKQAAMNRAARLYCDGQTETIGP